MEQDRDRIAEDHVALLFQEVHMAAGLDDLGIAVLPQFGHGHGQGIAAGHELVDQQGHRQGRMLDAEEHAITHRGVDQVDDVIDALGQALQILAIDGRYEGAPEGFEHVVEGLITLMLEVLDALAEHGQRRRAVLQLGQLLGRQIEDAGMTFEDVVEVVGTGQYQTEDGLQTHEQGWWRRDWRSRDLHEVITASSCYGVRSDRGAQTTHQRPVASDQ
jgi:uncharacterized protein YjiS (DUF1127 family)